MIKLIAIDCGGVYFHWNHKKYLSELAKIAQVNTKLAKKAAVKYVRDLHVCKITEKQYWHSFCKIIRKNIDHDKLKNVGLRQFKPNKPVIKLMKNLRKKYLIALVANQTPVLDQIDRKYKFYKNFDYNFSSHKVKLQKPGTAIFKLLMKKARVKPKEIIFIDDRKKNISAYKKMGIKTILFKNFNQLKKELKKII